MCVAVILSGKKGVVLQLHKSYKCVVLKSVVYFLHFCRDNKMTLFEKGIRWLVFVTICVGFLYIYEMLLLLCVLILPVAYFLATLRFVLIIVFFKRRMLNYDFLK